MDATFWFRLQADDRAGAAQTAPEEERTCAAVGFTVAHGSMADAHITAETWPIAPQMTQGCLCAILNARFGTEALKGEFWESSPLCDQQGLSEIVSESRVHARQAAAALLKMAQVTSDQALAGRLVEAAADLKDQIGELAPPVSIQPPDVQTKRNPD